MQAVTRSVKPLIVSAIKAFGFGLLFQSGNLLPCFVPVIPLYVLLSKVGFIPPPPTLHIYLATVSFMALHPLSPLSYNHRTGLSELLFSYHLLSFHHFSFTVSISSKWHIIPLLSECLSQKKRAYPKGALFSFFI